MMSGSRGMSMCITVLAVALLVTRWIVSLRPDGATVNYSAAVENSEYPPFEGGAFGPESLAFDGNGDGPFVGLSDGRIVKWDESQRRWIDFAFTSPPNREELCRGVDRPPHDHEATEHICGRPLGLRFHFDSGDLYIADAYLGLLVVGPNGGLAHKVTVRGESVPLGFINGLDIDQGRGLVYFTESSTRFSRRSYFSAIVTGDSSGRLLRYHIKTNRLSLLLTNLTFPNGLSLTKDDTSILIAESTNCRILKYWPHSAAPKLQVFADNLLGYPDNINRVETQDKHDNFWVGIYSRRTNLAHWALSRPWLGETVVRGRPIWLKLITAIVRRTAVGVAVKLNEQGRVVQVLEDQSGKLKFISEVVEREDGRLMFGSVIMPVVRLCNSTTTKTMDENGDKYNLEYHNNR